MGGEGYVCLLTQAAQREVNGADGQSATPWVEEQSRLIWLRKPLPALRQPRREASRASALRATSR